MRLIISRALSSPGAVRKGKMKKRIPHSDRPARDSHSFSCYVDGLFVSQWRSPATHDCFVDARKQNIEEDEQIGDYQAKKCRQIQFQSISNN